MKKQNKHYEELKKELVKALDSLLDKEAKKLEKAIKGYLATTDNPGDVELLVEAGLVRCVGNYGCLHHDEYVYEATQKGLKLYERMEEIKRKTTIKTEIDTGACGPPLDDPSLDCGLCRFFQS